MTAQMLVAEVLPDRVATLTSIPASMACFSSVSFPGCAVAASSGSTSAPSGAFEAGHACLNGV